MASDNRPQRGPDVDATLWARVHADKSPTQEGFTTEWLPEQQGKVAPAMDVEVMSESHYGWTDYAVAFEARTANGYSMLSMTPQAARRFALSILRLCDTAERLRDD